MEITNIELLILSQDTDKIDWALASVTKTPTRLYYYILLYNPTIPPTFIDRNIQCQRKIDFISDASPCQRPFVFNIFKSKDLCACHGVSQRPNSKVWPIYYEIIHSA